MPPVPRKKKKEKRKKHGDIHSPEYMCTNGYINIYFNLTSSSMCGLCIGSE